MPCQYSRYVIVQKYSVHVDLHNFMNKYNTMIHMYQYSIKNIWCKLLFMSSIPLFYSKIPRSNTKYGSTCSFPVSFCLSICLIQVGLLIPHIIQTKIIPVSWMHCTFKYILSWNTICFCWSLKMEKYLESSVAGIIQMIILWTIVASTRHCHSLTHVNIHVLISSQDC